jgi:hypothetical protein
MYFIGLEFRVVVFENELAWFFCLLKQHSS